MSESLKISGKRFVLPSAGKSDWKFHRRPGGWILAERGGSRVRLMCVKRGGSLGANIGGRLLQGEIIAESTERNAAASGTDSDLVAQFPGKVRKVLVAEGGNVAESQPLILIEAMKMEFAVKAPFAGKIARVLVKEGQQLSPGDRFFDLEKSRGDE